MTISVRVAEMEHTLELIEPQLFWFNGIWSTRSV